MSSSLYICSKFLKKDTDMRIFSYILLLLAIIIVSCNQDENTKDENSSPQEAKDEPHIAIVVDKINAGSYTYLQVTENKQTYWIAVPAMQVELGETVYFSKFMEMKNFKSETLERTFNSILFVDDIRKSATPDHMKQVHSGAMSVSKQNIKIEFLEDGYTVEQIYAKRNELNGKLVEVKGKVVKFNPQIMNRNWVHIQDGTGNENDYDLVITTNSEAKVGDIIVAEGTVTKDKDFGAGYFFPVLIEKAEIEIE